MNLYIDIAISMILIFLVFSVIVYVLQEMVAINLQYRGKMLWRSLAQVLDGVKFKNDRALDNNGIVDGKGTPLTNLIFDHPQIQALQKNDKTKMSYIPPSNFSLALVEMIAQNAPAASGDLLTDFSNGLDILAKQVGYTTSNFLPGTKPTIPAVAQPPIVAVLLSIKKVSNSVDELRKNIEKWYNDYMNRVTGWYQTHTLLTVRLIAFCVTIAFNLNCIQLVKDIANNSMLRTNLVGIADGVTKHPEIVNNLYDRRFAADSAGIRHYFEGKTKLSGIDSAGFSQAVLQGEEDSLNKTVATFNDLEIRNMRTLTDTLSAVHLPIGWASGRWKSTPGDILLALLGWLITAGCLSMGAPFWFNLLMQIVNVRRAGIKPAADGNK
jgi:hypothetical protein